MKLLLVFVHLLLYHKRSYRKRAGEKQSGLPYSGSTLYIGVREKKKKHNCFKSCRLRLLTPIQEMETIMLQTHLIAELLGMEGYDFEKVTQSETNIVLTVRMKRRAQECPACRTPCDQVHDYRTQRVKDSPIQGKIVVWEYRKRRYRCSCCGKRFYEGNYLLPKRHRITNRLAALGIDQLRKKQSRKEIATSLGVSESSVCRWMNLLEFGKPPLLPKILSIDEFRGNTEHEKFQCILTDPAHKKIIDILPTRKHEQIYNYLREFPSRKQVQYFVMDMNRDYLSIAKSLLPNATIVIDRFHVVRYCTWAVEKVRKNFQKKLLPEQRKYFKRGRKLHFFRTWKTSMTKTRLLSSECC